jgi:hypothetical protein
MPCDSGPYDEYEREIRTLTRLLCAAVALIPAPWWNYAPRELLAWKKDHDEADANERRERDAEAHAKQLRRAGFAKLTADERAALGISSRDLE